ncbi:MAG: hypothetical protein AAFR81_16910 [Chloroflexota bacterium]
MGVKLWHIYFIRDCKYVKPEPKDKLIIVTSAIDGEYIGFFINSRISDFVRAQEHLLECQSYIRASDHTCLTHDSTVSCDTPYLFTEDDLSDIRDAVSDDAKNVILRAVKICTTIPRRYKREILKADTDENDV